MPEACADAFLARAGWADARSEALAGDASARRYLRLVRPDGARAVLMIAPPAPDDSTRRFCALAVTLAARGLSVPRLLAAAPESGFALLEDLGDAIFARVIAVDPTQETPLYAAAIDLLAAFRGAEPPAGLAAPDAATLAGMTAPAADWYLGRGSARPDVAAAFAEALTPLLGGTLDGPRGFVHRDFHAENLIWLPGRAGVARVGVLDFQDAFAGPAAYDLVSLLEDARRDTAPDLRAAMVARFAAVTGTAPDRLARDLAVLGAQRNLRILGIFARLSLHLGKARYIALIPRVWAHLAGDLAHPDLAGLRRIVAETLPAPTPDLLQRLTPTCPMIPTP